MIFCYHVITIFYFSYACTRAGLTRADYPCSPGFYCPGGNYAPNQTAYACPPGTFNDFNNLTAIDQCVTCPPTVACLIATGGQQKPPVACATGHFCPAGTGSPSQYPCPAGSWTNQTNLASQELCYPCPRSYYCLEGSSTPTGLCFTGHWCPHSKLWLLDSLAAFKVCWWYSVSDIFGSSLMNNSSY